MFYDIERVEMVSKSKSVDEKIAELKALQEDASPAAITILRNALADRTNHVIARAAEIVAKTGQQELARDLVTAFERLMIDPIKKDPGCVGKRALAEALVRLEYEDMDVFREGIDHSQLEPVWGGTADTAAPLRSACAIGLVRYAGRVEVLNRCALLLVDRYKEARIGGIRAIAALAVPEGAALLRLKLLVGDTDSEVVGECCSALLQLAQVVDAGAEAVAAQREAVGPATGHVMLLEDEDLLARLGERDGGGQPPHPRANHHRIGVEHGPVTSSYFNFSCRFPCLQLSESNVAVKTNSFSFTNAPERMLS